MVSVAGLVINFIMLFFAVGLAIAIFVFRQYLQTCETKESPFCYDVPCPCDDNKGAPCFGYAKKSAGTGVWYCSNSPYTKVDDNGNVV